MANIKPDSELTAAECEAECVRLFPTFRFEKRAGEKSETRDGKPLVTKDNLLWTAYGRGGSGELLKWGKSMEPDVDVESSPFFNDEPRARAALLLQALVTLRKLVSQGIVPAPKSEVP